MAPWPAINIGAKEPMERITSGARYCLSENPKEWGLIGLARNAITEWESKRDGSRPFAGTSSTPNQRLTAIYILNSYPSNIEIEFGKKEHH